MKKLIYTLTFCSCLFVSAQSAGVFLGDGDNNGKSFSIGSDESVTTVLKIANDYSAKDSEALLTNYTEKFSTQSLNWAKWLGSMETITMKPYMIIPVKMEGSENTMVLAWSTEDRNFTDGSKENLNLMEIFTVDNENKVADYNNKDAAACSEAFAVGAEFLDSEGTKMILNEDLWVSLFNSFKEQSWEVYSIVPLKIQNTDTESGVTVFSRERRVLADGTVWEKELVEWFYFNKDGKISRATQYARSLPKE